jgi:hypothetical protein
MEARKSDHFRDPLRAELPLSLRCGVVDNEFWAAAVHLLRRTDCVVYRWLPHPKQGTGWRGERVTGVAYVTSEDRALFVPEPLDPWSFGVVAHEVAHQVLHRKRRRMPVWQRELEADEYALNRFDEFGLPGAEEFRRSVTEHLERCFQRALDRGARIESILDGAEGWVTERLVARDWQRRAARQLRMSADLLDILMFPADPPPGVNIAALLRPYARGEMTPRVTLTMQAEALASLYGVDLDAPAVDDRGPLS